MKTVEERMLSKINKTDNCWLWTGKPNQGGYGRLGIDGRNYLAHRLAYQLWVGEIPEDKPHVCHHCDNPPCVNPEHLFTGNDADNNKDMCAKGRGIYPGNPKNKKATHCPRNHEYNEANTYISKKGGRFCRKCNNRSRRISYRKRKLHEI